MKAMEKKENERNPLVLAVTGASGAIYAYRLLEILMSQNVETHLVITKTAEHIIRTELSNEKANFILKEAGVKRHDPDKYAVEIASGSYITSGMAIVPASMGTVGRIANGTSDNLVARCADVHLKERRTLVVVPRETPLNRIHLENLLRLHDAGAVILPAMPSFYAGADSIELLVDTVVARILDHLGIGHGLNIRYHPEN
jgi:4-hydroxy-3-polyprenylbenzoate decarboxylase